MAELIPDDLDLFDDGTIPCEFCGEQVPFYDSVVHETSCNPEGTSYATTTLNIPSDGESEGSIDDDDNGKDLINLTNDLVINNQAHIPKTQNVAERSLTNNQANAQNQKSSSNKTTSATNFKFEDEYINPIDLRTSYVESLNKINPAIFDLKSKGAFNIKTKKSEVLNNESSTSTADIEEALCRSFTSKTNSSIFSSSEDNVSEEVDLSDDDDAGETIEQFWERAEIYLKKRLEDIKNRKKGMNFNKTQFNFSGRSAY